MKKIKWCKIGARPSDLQKSIQFGYGIGIDFRKTFGIDAIKNQLYFFDGRTTTFYFGENDFNKFSKKFKEKLRDFNSLSSITKKTIKVCNETLKRAKKLISYLIPKITKKELTFFHQKYENIWHSFYPYAWSIFFLPILEEVVREVLISELKNDERVEETLRIVSQPYLITPVMVSEIAILKFAKDVATKNKTKIFKKAHQLSKKFGWMSVYNFNDEPRPFSYYIEEAKKILVQSTDIDKKLAELKKSRLENERKYRKILDNISNPLIKKQIELLHVAGYLRDKREETRDRLTLIERELYQRIADDISFSLKDVLYLTSLEIENILLSKGLQKKIKNISLRRQKQFALVITNDRLRVFDKRQDIKRIEETLIIAKKKTVAIQGQVAFKQSKKTRGFAKIVLNNKELNKVKTGDILIATMTKPDYVSAMKRAAAFITDEGGVTCHAAILAREMKKPCIIGTKIATKVLKDGDLVEVDAEKGIVRIIKKLSPKLRG